ncbi:pectinesterase family protein [Streptomyces sp. yr375]|uniref:pectinesterase family protein n=1 Tax=Streptomyces sp. yr375 TaxID=1761906 RepID=UPI00210B5A5D|nr:pectinesterase family protein [Streptomyces sp. yr375]
MVHHSTKNTKGKDLLEESDKLVASDGTGDFWTVQDAINALPRSGANTIFIDKGAYAEAITVPANRPFLTLQGVSGNPVDVVITNNRAHAMLKPDGTPWGTEGSATATFKAPNLTVRDLTISNTFNPANHPEISPFETQAVAVCARGDRQFFFNCRITARQDTLLVKAPTPTDQVRSYFANCFIQGSVDFIFGNATSVIDRCTLQVDNWVGGTVLAPNTDWRQKYGILIVGSDILTPNVPANTMYLGRPWHNVQEAWPQAVIRETEIRSGITAAHPWTDMTPDYPWSWTRFKEYRNDGPGAGFGTNAPQLSDTEALEYTAEKYLAGNDGWNPIW